MSKYQKPVLNYNADDVWASACQAQQVNGSYVKLSALTENQLTTGVRSNRELIVSLMEDTTKITDESREQGLKVRKYYQGLTFKVLKGIKLNDFDNNVMLISNRDVITENFDLAVIASLPNSYVRAVERDNVDQRIKFATGGFIGKAGDKITQKIEIVKQIWSTKWDTHYITGINDKDQVLFFSHKNLLEVGKSVTIEGTVKSHREDSTQLNRVKVI
jgi:hypothetical protein